MFITVSYGADCHEIVNVQCRVLSLTAHLKRKCQCRPEDCVDLLDESGTLMNLSQVESPGSELARKYLQERQHYILIRVVQRLQKLSAHPPLKDGTGKTSTQRKFGQAKEPHLGSPAKLRSTQQTKKVLSSPAGPDT
ncbi:uncharacterized protein C22orf15 homolog isoform X3 [Pelodiscus sinensis]|uniref:uncharacterized protein C22orf15 homolog isoform X3 n=1 Tax=Pelodiscus sinensis TaxID=13735 RepID=UPI003F6B0985